MECKPVNQSARVREARYRASLPSEPDVKGALHPAHVILTEILAVGKREIGAIIRFLGCSSQSLEKPLSSERRPLRSCTPRRHRSNF
jgi:hypothetical protein